MSTSFTPLSTGITELDTILQVIMPGDNLVWQVDSIEEYQPFARSFAENALSQGRRLIYFRFSEHRDLLEGIDGVEIHPIDPSDGFESFTAAIHQVISKAGRETCFVFDCLSDLPVHWSSDLMLGNFFILTCPYIYQLDSLAYFALFRYRHSIQVVATIRETTQILIDAFRYNGEFYLHPLKVMDRYSPTMYLPHIWRNGEFTAVTDSAAVSEVSTATMGTGIDPTARCVEAWDQSFITAQRIQDKVQNHEAPPQETEPVFGKVLRMAVTRDSGMLDLAMRHLSLEDVLSVKRRMVGSGLIGGKAAGMLLARAILRKADKRWDTLLEVHDSFYIASDVFYSFIVRNGCWNVLRKQLDPETFLDGIDEGSQRIISGEFMASIHDQLIEIFDYFGQSPIIVRSSSFLEDTLDGSGPRPSFVAICPNQGRRRDRFETFMNAIRKVYASVLDRETLIRRRDAGTLNYNEQMSVLIQRMSGTVSDGIFLPALSGRCASRIERPWSTDIAADAMGLQLACGLGMPNLGEDDAVEFAVGPSSVTLNPDSGQRTVSFIDMEKNAVTSSLAGEFTPPATDCPHELIFGKKGKASGTPTFAGLMNQTGFADDLHTLMTAIKAAYGRDITVDFTLNTAPDGAYRINLLQCRPMT